MQWVDSQISNSGSFRIPADLDKTLFSKVYCSVAGFNEGRLKQTKARPSHAYGIPCNSSYSIFQPYHQPDPSFDHIERSNRSIQLRTHTGSHSPLNTDPPDAACIVRLTLLLFCHPNTGAIATVIFVLISEGGLIPAVFSSSEGILYLSRWGKWDVWIGDAGAMWEDGRCGRVSEEVDVCSGLYWTRKAATAREIHANIIGLTLILNGIYSVKCYIRHSFMYDAPAVGVLQMSR